MDLNNLSANLTNITNSFAEKPSIATLATVLLSVTGLQDWIKLFLIGSAFETCRRVAFQAWHNITDSFWITVDFEEGDDSYGNSFVPPAQRSIADHRFTDWMMVWLSQHPAWTRARKLAVSTSTFGLETALDDFGNPKNGRKVRFVVAYDHVSTFWYKRRYVEAVRSKPEGLSYRVARSLRLR